MARVTRKELIPLGQPVGEVVKKATQKPRKPVRNVLVGRPKTALAERKAQIAAVRAALSTMFGRS